MNNTAHPRGTSFVKTADVRLPRSKFDLSHGYKTTFDGGYLVPVMVSEMLPGDSWKCDLKQVCRFTNAALQPFMDRIRINYFAFAVPKRLLWSNFEDFITGSHKGKVGTTHTTYPTAAIPSSSWTAGSVYDYMGIPKPATGETLNVNALPLRAYNLVWNEWFRDENLCTEIAIDLGDSDINNTYTLKKRGKRKDYFTSCLPFVQKGPDVLLPLGGVAPVRGNGMALGISDGTNNFGLQTGNNGVASVALSFSSSSYGSSVGANSGLAGTDGKIIGVTTDYDKSGLVADLSNATASTINNLREAFAIQSLFENDARHGSRYVESLLGHFGVQSPDFRLQRPEYIGGGEIDFHVSTVAQTSAASTGQTPLGNLASYVASAGQVGFQYSAVEHCICLVLACVTTDLTYQYGLNKMWSRSVRTDEYWPEFAKLGEQAVREKEIWCTGNATNDDAVFGYQERYAEYRYIPSLITGKLRSSDPQSLDSWHLAQAFNSAPSLSQAFIEEDPPFSRVLAVQNEPQFVLDVWFDIKAMRPLPLFGTPATLTHF